MGTDDENDMENPDVRITPEQIAIIIIMIGFVIMLVGILLTKEILSVYFTVGIVIGSIGIFLYIITLYSRIWVMEHIPVAIPESLRYFLKYGVVKNSSKPPVVPTSVPAPFIPPSRPTPAPVPVPQAAIPNTPYQTQTPPVSPQINVPAMSAPQAGMETAVGMDFLEEVSTAPSPSFPTTPFQSTPVPAPALTTPPAAEKDDFMDVLEESDKEFESFIDKLIEE